MSVKKLLTLDVTNTILRVSGTVGRHYANAAKRHGNEVTDPDALNVAFKKIWKEQNKNCPNFGLKEGLNPQQWWAGVVSKTFQLAGYSIPDGTMAYINTKLYESFTAPEYWDVLPGTTEILERLQNFRQSGNLSVGIISNYDERLDAVLSNLGLRSKFDFVVTSAFAKAAKPEPKIFSKALEFSGIPANQALHVGDDFDNDFMGATRAGMDAVLLSPSGDAHHSIPSNRLIKSLDEIFGFLE